MHYRALPVFLLLLAVSGCSGGEDNGGIAPGQDTVAAERITWIYSLQDGLSAAGQAGMPVMADFFADWCHWCRKLDKETYTDKSVTEISRKFICVKIDTEKDADSAARYRINGLPTILFLDKNGNIISEVVGFRDADGMLSEMHKALDK